MSVARVSVCPVGRTGRPLNTGVTVNLRRTVLSAVAAAAAGLTLSAMPASAQPDISLSGVESRAGVQVAPVVCQTGVAGFTPTNRFVYRAVQNTSLMMKDRVANRTVPFKPLSSAPFARTATALKVITLNSDGRPRVVTYVQNAETDVLALKSVQVLLNRDFRHRLITNSGTFHYYMVDRAGTLRRWTAFRNNRGQLFFDKQKAVKTGQGNLKTLSFYTRTRFDGVLTDVLVGTTKTGALKQFRIPANRPGSPKVITLRKTGFKRYTAISLSQCGADQPNPNHASLVAIDAGANLAHGYHMKPFLRPAKPAIVNFGKVAPTRNWRLHATF
jgi:hypothetical protein